MAPEVLVPAGDAVRAFAWGVAVGGCLFGGVCWCWAAALAWERGRRYGFVEGYPRGRRRGYDVGVREAGALERLVALDAAEQASQGIRAALRRHEAAVREWDEERQR